MPSQSATANPLAAHARSPPAKRPTTRRLDFECQRQAVFELKCNFPFRHPGFAVSPPEERLTRK